MRSDNVTKGSERAPNRSLFYALVLMFKTPFLSSV